MVIKNRLILYMTIGIKIAFYKNQKKYLILHTKNNYHYQPSKVPLIYHHASEVKSSMPYTPNTELIIKETAKELISSIDALEMIREEMNQIASQLPEYPVVLSLHGVGTTLGPQLIAEIGDVRRFHNLKALIAYAGIDSSPY